MPNDNQVLGNYQLVRELEALRARLERSAVANVDVPPTAMTRSGGTPPRISGLGVQQSPGSVEVSWNPATIPDLRYYELSIGTNGTFGADALTVRVGSPRHTFSGTDGTNYTFRARVVNQAGNASSWSNVVSSRPGLINTSGITPLAATAIYRFEKVSGFTPLSSNGVATLPLVEYNQSADFGPLLVTVDDASSVVQPRAFLNFAMASVFDTIGDTAPVLSFTIALLRDGLVIDESVTDIQSTYTSNAVEAPSFASYDQPGVGTFSYTYRVSIKVLTTSGTSYLTLTPNNVLMEFIQNKR